MRNAILAALAVLALLCAAAIALTAEVHGDRDPIGRINQTKPSYVR